jgi:hypothetical protein
VVFLNRSHIRTGTAEHSGCPVVSLERIFKVARSLKTPGHLSRGRALFSAFQREPTAQGEEIDFGTTFTYCRSGFVELGAAQQTKLTIAFLRKANG